MEGGHTEVFNGHDAFESPVGTVLRRTLLLPILGVSFDKTVDCQERGRVEDGGSGYLSVTWDLVTVVRLPLPLSGFEKVRWKFRLPPPYILYNLKMATA
ncbi:hypothetical protein BHM03_00047984 [Ensete ventricosum]|nr:hypothetical protein BHM03_00047984 [Ensete ventricosum]